jgi:hypothetical protein
MRVEGLGVLSDFRVCEGYASLLGGGLRFVGIL